MTKEFSPENLFSSWMETPSMCLLKSINEGADFQCVYSSTISYKTGSTYSIYEIPGLIRLIGKKIDLFTKGLQQQLSENSKQLPIVLHWEGKDREILLVELELESEVNQEFKDNIEINREKLREWLYLEEKRTGAERTKL